MTLRAASWLGIGEVDVERAIRDAITDFHMDRSDPDALPIDNYVVHVTNTLKTVELGVLAALACPEKDLPASLVDALCDRYPELDRDLSLEHGELMTPEGQAIVPGTPTKIPVTGAANCTPQMDEKIIAAGGQYAEKDASGNYKPVTVEPWDCAMCGKEQADEPCGYLDQYETVDPLCPECTARGGINIESLGHMNYGTVRDADVVNQVMEENKAAADTVPEGALPEYTYQGAFEAYAAGKLKPGENFLMLRHGTKVPAAWNLDAQENTRLDVGWEEISKKAVLA